MLRVAMVLTNTISKQGGKARTVKVTSTVTADEGDAGIKVVVIEPGPIRSRIMENARARFLATIDVERSPFRAAYERELARLASGNRSSRFKLGPEAVFSKLVLALESPSPSPRYRVTIPTHVSAWLKRILPTGMLDRILLRQRS